jgi:hypothetical protein
MRDPMLVPLSGDEGGQLVYGEREDVPAPPFSPAQAYGELGVVPTFGGELPLVPGMTFAFEPSCVIGDHMVNVGGTLVVGEDGPIELNASTARLLRV